MEEDMLNKSIKLLKSEIAIYDNYYCLATSQAIKNVLSELEKLQKENKELKYKYDKALSDLVEADEKNNKLTWEDIQNNVNKPVWDNKNKTWVIIEGIQNYRGTRKATLNNTFGWEIYEDLELYKEEK